MIELFIQNNGQTVAHAEGQTAVTLVYDPPYRKGDCAVVRVSMPGFYTIHLEDTMQPSTVFIPHTEARFPIPFGVLAAGYSPRSFKGKRHLLSVRQSTEAEIYETRNLAYNPYDTKGEPQETGMFPHVTTNVAYPESLRNKIFPDIGLFAARNAIDGICENRSHRLYPYQSWGINRMKDAWLRLEFGCPVNLDHITLVLRSEFPHDTYWRQATVAFEYPDGNTSRDCEQLTLQKTEAPQSFPVNRQGVTALILCDLIKADEPSEYPALTQLMAYGRICR